MDSVRTVSQGSALPRLEAHMLWQQVLNVPRAWLIAHDTDPLAPASVAAFRKLAQRRIAGEPMAYIVGHREFMGHEFRVSPDVLIPRPETELLVEIGLHSIENVQAPRVLDLGTGSGAIAVSIALARPDAVVVATDYSGAALDVARLNAHHLGAKVEFLLGNWYDALSAHKGFHVIVSNPPYIAAGDGHLRQGDVRFEPAAALTDGADGLSALQRIIQEAGQWLVRHGALFVEHGWDQGHEVRQRLRQAGFAQVASSPDLAGIDRVTGGIYN
ncbi:MAG TPA: peptide chain release factor N(5)-glutamine methyltransferase [Candidimonas sp.]|nr:peptide chain release factor N(5)-glutamine methyltransferase [Candidimonas sp.]